MPPPASPPGFYAGLLVIVTMMGMLRAWVWAIRRRLAGLSLLPEPEPREVPWGGWSVLLVLFNYIVIQILATVSWCVSMRRQPADLTYTEMMFIISVLNGILLVLVPILLRLTSRATLADVGIGGRNLRRDARIGGMAFLLITPVVYALNGMALLIWSPSKHPLEKMVRMEFSGGTAYLAFLSAVVLAPAAEELIFRGIIQGWLARRLADRRAEKALPPEDFAPIEPIEPGSTVDFEDPPIEWFPRPPGPVRARLGRWRRSSMLPVVLTSGGFALVHVGQWPAPLGIFFLSLGLGVIYQRSGSLVASFVMHALFNGIATLLLFLSQI